MRPEDQPELKFMIAVIGDANLPIEHEKYIMATECGRLLVDNDFRVLTGGMGGVMEAACRGGRQSESHTDGDTIGILPGLDPSEANPFIDIVIPTGLDYGRNTIVANSDAVIAIGGGAGTLSEIALAWQLKRLIIALRVDGWSGNLADTKIDSRVRHKHWEDDRVFGAETPEEAVRILVESLPKYERRHRGVRRRN